MATNLEHPDGDQSTIGPIIDAIPEESLFKSNNELSQERAPDESKEKSEDHAASNATPVTSRANFAVPQIDISSGPAMVTPLQLLQRQPQWIDCPFCKRMAKTRVTFKQEREEPSVYVFLWSTILN